ncbi:MAG: O-antigen ligase domain-containing protein [Roseococcus sp.]|nr:O-antigen ligase domain-containing protein [Roseococcus sp.]
MEGLAAGGLGLAAAVLHFAGALKAAGFLHALPLDLTALALAATLGLLALLLAAREPVAGRGVGLVLAAAAALWLWWVLSAAWSPWPEEARKRLLDMALLGPVMLAAGLLAGAEERARRGFVAATLVIGPFVGLVIAHGLATDSIVLGGEIGRDPARVRVAYQIAGLAIACAGGLAALRVVTARGWARLFWLGLLLGLGAAVLLPGGRAAFLGMLATVALGPALLLVLLRRPGRALLWLGLALGGGAGLLALVMLDPGRAENLATLERLLRGMGDAPSARDQIWGTAWRLGGWTGLGPGGFPIALGAGQDRGFHPHNHAIEAMVEGGAVGLLLWLLVFPGGALLAAARARQVAPARAAEIFALCLPVAISVMVSTDLGNRMAWLTLGLALSLGVEMRPRRAWAARHV